MITKSGTSNDIINHFRCLESDIEANKHLPNDKGIMEATGVKLKNGDEIAVMDGQKKIYMYDQENKIWLEY